MCAWLYACVDVCVCVSLKFAIGGGWWNDHSPTAERRRATCFPLNMVRLLCDLNWMRNTSGAKLVNVSFSCKLNSEPMDTLVTEHLHKIFRPRDLQYNAT